MECWYQPQENRFCRLGCEYSDESEVLERLSEVLEISSEVLERSSSKGGIRWEVNSITCKKQVLSISSRAIHTLTVINYRYVCS